MKPKFKSNGCSGNHQSRFGNSKLRFVWRSGLIFLAISAAVLAFGFAVKFLWSVSLTPLFGLPIPGFWQAVALVVLARILFGGFSHGGPRDRKKRYPAKPPWHRSGYNWDDDYSSSDIQIPKEQREYYTAFWREKGKEAFEEYLKSAEKKESSTDEKQDD